MFINLGDSKYYYNYAHLFIQRVLQLQNNTHEKESERKEGNKRKGDIREDLSTIQLKLHDETS